MKISEIQD